MVWSRLYFNITQFLKFVDCDGSELMDFYHVILREVVEKKIGEEILEQCHKEIIRYFEDDSKQPVFYVDGQKKSLTAENFMNFRINI